MRSRRWWRRRRYVNGYNDVLDAFNAGMSDPAVGEVTIHRAEGSGPYIEGWNQAVKDLTLSAMRDLAGYG